MNSGEQFVRSYLDAWNEQDASGVVSHLCKGGTYLDVPAQQSLSGKAFADHLIDYFSNEHYHYELFGDVLTNGNTIAFQYRVLPRDPASGEQGWGGAEFIELKGDVAQRIHDYYRLPAADPARSGASGRRYAKSGLNDAAMSELLAALDRAMKDDRVFLDPDLSLPKLAELLNCSVNHLSQAINAGHAVSFFDYVNQYRVVEAAKMLRQKDCQFPAVLDVALSVGFNSTSTFYTAFKKAMGQTPAKYRRSQPPM